MEAAGLALPELDLLGAERVAAPEGRARDVPTREPFLDLAHQGVQRLAVGQRLALGRGPGADLGVARAGREVLVGLRLGQPLHGPADPHLAVELAPVEDERSPVCRLQLSCLGRLEVGEESKRLRTEALEQDHASVGRAIRVHGRQGHRSRQRHLPLGPLVPLAELLDRVVGQRRAVKRRHVGTARHRRRQPSDRKPTVLAPSTVPASRGPHTLWWTTFRPHTGRNPVQVDPRRDQRVADQRARNPGLATVTRGLLEWAAGAISSVGQSASLIRRRSLVRVQDRPLSPSAAGGLSHRSPAARWSPGSPTVSAGRGGLSHRSPAARWSPGSPTVSVGRGERRRCADPYTWARSAATRCIASSDCSSQFRK